MKPNYIIDADWQLMNQILIADPEEVYLVAGIGWHETRFGTIGAGKIGYHLGFGYWSGSPYLEKYKGLENQLKGAHKMIVANFKFPVTLESVTDFAFNHWKSSVPTAWAKSVYNKFMEITRMNYNDHLTRNLIFGESWSTKVIAGIQFRRRVAPSGENLEEVKITAVEYQKIRDKLNEIHGTNKKIGPRDKLGEIMLYVNSFWRELIFQAWLFIHKKSTTSTGDHPFGRAIDLRCPTGMTPADFLKFITEKCNTKFNWFKVYSWGVHCSRR
jgi:hypothetical protein